MQISISCRILMVTDQALSLWHNFMVLYINVVADPGFPRGRRQHINWQCFPENCMKIKTFWRGERTPSIDPPMQLLPHLREGICRKLFKNTASRCQNDFGILELYFYVLCEKADPEILKKLPWTFFPTCFAGIQKHSPLGSYTDTFMTLLWEKKHGMGAMR